MEARLAAIPGLTDVTSDLQIKNPQVKVTIDRDRAAADGITVDQIEDALYDAYGARQVSTIYTTTNQYWVVMELQPQYQRDLDALSLISIRGDQWPAGAARRRSPPSRRASARSPSTTPASCRR